MGRGMVYLFILWFLCFVFSKALSRLWYQGSDAMMPLKQVYGILKILGLGAYFTFALGPIIWIAMMSLKNSHDVIASPPKFVFNAHHGKL